MNCSTFRRFAVLSLLALCACSSGSRPPVITGPNGELMDLSFTWMRVMNATAVTFDDLIVGSMDIGPLEAGEFTDYVLQDTPVYSYTYVEVSVGGEKLVLQPVDYVGETPLSAGAWTYEITLDSDVAPTRAGIGAVRDA